MSSKTFIFLLFLILWATTGCGIRNEKLTGKITYPDGTPLSQGFVFFDSTTSNFQARAEIMKDGTYTAGSVNVNDGLPAGKYAVYVISEKRGDSGRLPLVAPKFTSGTTSGLVCEIPSPNNRFDFQVEPFTGEIKGNPLAPIPVVEVPK